MNYFNDSNPWSNVTIVADHQSAGKGRKQNEWISPPGSLSMSFGFDIDFIKSEHPAAIQHIIAIAMVAQLREMTQRLDLIFRSFNKNQLVTT